MFKSTVDFLRKNEKTIAISILVVASILLVGYLVFHFLVQGETTSPSNGSSKGSSSGTTNMTVQEKAEQDAIDYYHMNAGDHGHIDNTLAYQDVQTDYYRRGY